MTDGTFHYFGLQNQWFNVIELYKLKNEEIFDRMGFKVLVLWKLSSYCFYTSNIS